MFTSGCDQKIVSREYEEIIIDSPLKSHSVAHNDPHGFMGMGFDHPDISQMMANVSDDPQTQKQLDASVVKAPLSWRTPNGWSEVVGGRMRLVTFRSKDSTKPIECTIVSLGGRAGGLKSNIVRWMNQVNIAIPPDDQLQSFVDGLETIGAQGGFSLKVVDLTSLVDGGQLPSMISAVAQLSDMTVFVKMTGNKNALIENRDQFKTLCKSLKIN